MSGLRRMWQVPVSVSPRGPGRSWGLRDPPLLSLIPLLLSLMPLVLSEQRVPVWWDNTLLLALGVEVGVGAGSLLFPTYGFQV